MNAARTLISTWPDSPYKTYFVDGLKVTSTTKAEDPHLWVSVKKVEAPIEIDYKRWISGKIDALYGRKDTIDSDQRKAELYIIYKNIINYFPLQEGENMTKSRQLKKTIEQLNWKWFGKEMYETVINNRAKDDNKNTGISRTWVFNELTSSLNK